MSSKDIRLGSRGEEILALCYRLGGLTVRQYYVLGEGRDPLAQADGAKSVGREAQKLLDEHVELIREWITDGVGNEEIALRMGLSKGSVQRFVARNGLRKDAE